MSPYRSGPVLVKLFNQFGANDFYPRTGGFPSRWQYAEEKLRLMNGNAAMRHFVKPFCYASECAPVLAHPGVKNVPLDTLGKLVNKANRSTAQAKLASCFRTCSEPLDANGRDRHSCPACFAMGFVGGTLWNEEVIDSDSGYSDGDTYEPPTETVSRTFSIEEFFCPICGLRLYGTKEVAAAELPEEFSTEEVRQREFEPDYGND